jgi:hypothetical protein
LQKLIILIIISNITSQEGGEKMATSFLLRDIPDSLHALIKSQAALEQVTMRTLFLKAVCQYLGMPYDEKKKGG